MVDRPILRASHILRRKCQCAHRAYCDPRLAGRGLEDSVKAWMPARSGRTPELRSGAEGTLI
ncbi:MAG TPA: hypothetical protein DEP35_17070 [Deltaproteobacteria bacterium]|jgi:hypothetical protein|nr:hypothetical protein [Deltaproteobacteria bacterium]